jgi:hypothetical protein
MNPTKALDDLFAIYLLAAIGGLVIGTGWIMWRSLEGKKVDRIISICGGVFVAWFWAACNSAQTWLMAVWSRVPKTATEWMKDSAFICGLIPAAAVFLLAAGIVDARRYPKKRVAGEG